MTLQELTSPGMELDETRQTKNAFKISVVTAILLGLTLLATFAVNRSLTADTISTATVAAGALVAGGSAWLCRRGRSNVGIILILATLTLIVGSRVFIQKGLAIPTGIVHIILVSSVAIYTLPAKLIGRVITSASLVAVAAIIADQFTTGVPASPTPEIATYIALAIGMIYLIILATQFPRLPLRAKLIIGFLFLTTLPLIILGWQTSTTTRAILEEQIQAKILENSLSTSADFQDVVDSQIAVIRSDAKLDEIVEYMSLPKSLRRNSEKERLVYELLAVVAKNDPIYTKSYALLDLEGTDILDTSSANIGRSYATHDFFERVVADRKPYVSGLMLIPETGDQNLYFAAPVNSKSNDLAGVLVVTYNAKIIQSTIEQLIRDNRAPATENMFLIDGANYFILGHSTRVDLLFKTYLDTTDPRLVDLEGRPLPNPEALSAPQPEMVAALSKMGDTGTFRVPSIEYEGELAQLAASRVPNTNWIVVAAQPLSAITAITQNQTRTTVITSIIIASLAALIAVFVSNFFTTPLIQLTRVAEKVSAGDFTQKTSVQTRDEIGVLASTFNKMSFQIQELVGNLERRVEQRTSDLEQTSRQSEKRAQDLQTITEVARFLSTEKDFERLLSLITQAVSERFGFYHIGIFLLDESKRFAVLRASNSPGGHQMLLRQHRLEVGQTGIVGNVTATGIPRIALETGADAIYFNNPNLPDTRSEMALPLVAGGSILGALDVQSTVPNAFSDSDISVLGVLADQIAIAIDNVRLIEEAQGALAESRAIFSEYLAEAWKRKTGSGVLGYHQSLTGGKIITDPSAPEFERLDLNGDKGLEIPIRVREQVIGVLNVRSISRDREWSADDVGVVQAVAERLGLALDNARLFEETSIRASRERLVTDITTKIRSTNSPQEMIKTAVDELQRALGATRVEIIPKKISPPPD